MPHFAHTRLILILVGTVFGCASEPGASSPEQTSQSDASMDGSEPVDSGSSVPADPPTDAGNGMDAGTDSQTDAGRGDGGQADAGVEAGQGITGPDVDRANPQLHEFTLDPAALDPSANDYIADQFAQLDTRSESLGKLVFFLPGANNSPGDWRNHGRKLAEFGFHVVIPHYNNAWSSSGNPCSGQGGSCNTDTRWEALTGEDDSSVVDISPADSAEGRVLAMLAHLQSAHPGGDWGYYLNGDGSLRDEHVIIAGISHGATSTGLFASRRGFWRAVMHSGGYGSVGADPATPLSAYYGLSHTDDPQHDGHLSSWESAGLPGSVTSIDGLAMVLADAHRLITSEPNGYPHCSVVVHSSSPTDASGNYMFEPTWRHMYGVEELLQ